MPLTMSRPTEAPSLDAAATHPGANWEADSLYCEACYAAELCPKCAGCGLPVVEQPLAWLDKAHPTPPLLPAPAPT